jgi:hypothetical protein
VFSELFIFRRCCLTSVVTLNTQYVNNQHSPLRETLRRARQVISTTVRGMNKWGMKNDEEMLSAFGAVYLMALAALFRQRNVQRPMSNFQRPLGTRLTDNGVVQIPRESRSFLVSFAFISSYDPRINFSPSFCFTREGVSA